MCWLVCCPLAAEMPDLLPITAPTIEGMESAVRQQLDDALATLRRMVAAADDTPQARRELAEAYGGIGQIYLAYDLVTAAAAALDNAHRLDPQEFRWPYLLASVEQNEGRLQRAAELFESALGLHTASDEWAVAAWIRLGNVRLDQDDSDAAAAAFSAALRLDDDAAAAHAGLGKSAALAGNPQQAVDHFRRALQLQPAADALHYPLAIAWRELGQRDAARQALSARGTTEAAFRDPLAEAVLKLATGSGVHLMYGNRALRKGRLDVALQRYRMALESNPRSAEAHQSLASVLEQQGQRSAAIEHYSSALALAPDNPSLHYNLGTILVDEGDDGQAERHFRAALRLAPDYQNARFNLAAVLARNGRFVEAAPLYETLLNSESQDDATRFYAAHTFQNLGRHDDANRLLQQLLEDDGNRPRARLALARGLLAVERAEAAEVQLRAVLDLPNVEWPQRRNAHLELARLNARQSRWDDALEHFEAVLQVDEGHREAHFGRAMTLLLAERYVLAGQVLESSVERLPDDPELQHLLARFLATCPVRTLRHGQRALELAFDLLQTRQSMDIAETVAMALAELERFAEAVQWQQRVIERARQTGRLGRLPELQATLERYRSGHPVTAPWLPPLEPSGASNP